MADKKKDTATKKASGVINRQSVAKSNAEASCKETAAICYMSTITLILHRFIMRSVAKTAISAIH